MKNVPFFLSLVIALFLVTCRGEDYTQDLSEIDSLKKVLVSTDSLIATLNTAEISRRTQEIADNSKFIQFNVNNFGDTLDYSTALLLTEYRETGNKFRFVNDEVKRLSNAIDSMNAGLENLKHDLENHSLGEGIDGKASVVHESTQVNAIHSYAVELIASLENTRKSYDTLLPKVNSYVNRVSARVAAVQEP
jgi:cob(I)alamin adenosyltransferase